jgi:acetyltransferase-like isoleucine patch superfamily enzyme
MRSMGNPKHNVFPDPFSLVPYIWNKLHTLWLASTYPFISVGDRVWFHYSCDLNRSVASHMKIGNRVRIHRDTWINIPEPPQTDEPTIILENGCGIGRGVQISAKNQIHFERDVMVAGYSFITDHNHAFEDVTVPTAHQGITDGGTIRIEEECWIGFGVTIVCGQGELVIGKHSVIGANSLVTRSIPPYSIVSGNPARIVKQFHPTNGTWELGGRIPMGQSQETQSVGR